MQEELTKIAVKIDKVTKERIEQCAEKKKQFDIVNDRHGWFSAKLERFGARRLGIIWVFIMILLFVIKMTCVSRGQLIFGAWCELVFWVNMRSIYVLHTPYAVTLLIATVAVGIYKG